MVHLEKWNLSIAVNISPKALACNKILVCLMSVEKEKAFHAERFNMPCSGLPNWVL